MVLHIVNLASATRTTFDNCLATLSAGHGVIFLNGEKFNAGALQQSIAELMAQDCEFFWLGTGVPAPFQQARSVTMEEFVELTERYRLCQTWF